MYTSVREVAYGIEVFSTNDLQLIFQ